MRIRIIRLILIYCYFRGLALCKTKLFSHHFHFSVLTDYYKILILLRKGGEERFRPGEGEAGEDPAEALKIWSFQDLKLWSFEDVNNTVLKTAFWPKHVQMRCWNWQSFPVCSSWNNLCFMYIYKYLFAIKISPMFIVQREMEVIEIQKPNRTAISSPMELKIRSQMPILAQFNQSICSSRKLIKIC